MSEQSSVPATPPVSRDAWEDWDNSLYDAATARELHARLRIAYTDREGQKTFRSVDVQRFALDGHGGGMLIAYCHLRHARRPFRIAGITHALDLDTVTRIDDLSTWLDARYRAGPRGARDVFMAEHEAALGVLFYVAKADDAFRAKEKDVISTFCADVGLHDPAVQKLVMEELAGWIKPSAIRFGIDLRAVAQRPPAYREAVVAAARTIIGTDKTVRDDESRALERMLKTFGKAPE